MFNSAILDTIIGLAFVYLLLSLLCSAINDAIVKFVGLRAQMLEEGIRQLLGDDEAAHQVYTHALHHNFLDVAQLEKRVTSKTLKSLTWLTRRFARNDATTYIPSRTFALALFNVMLPPDGKTPFTDVSALAQKIAPADTPSDRATLGTEGHQKKQSSLGAKARDSLIALLGEADDNYQQARANVETWFNLQMEHVSTLYRQQVQLIILALACGVTLLGNLDTFTFLETFWREPSARAMAVSAAQAYTSQHPAQSVNEVGSQVAQVNAQLQQFQIPLGWSLAFDGPNPLPRNFFEWLKKAIGLAFTTGAITLGAPFWFDVLRKLTSARAAITPAKSSEQ